MGKACQNFMSKKDLLRKSREEKKKRRHYSSEEEEGEEGEETEPQPIDQEFMKMTSMAEEVSEKTSEAFLKGLTISEKLERQRLLSRRSKRKQEVDTKASKGRKIRYVEIPKLVNFFPATPERIPWTHERRDELFTSLFI